MKLRPYQSQCVEQTINRLSDADSVLVVKPTGTGKTVTFSHLIDRWTTGRVMVLAHREELVFQAADKIGRITGEQVDIEMADFSHSPLLKRRIIVSTVQTQISGSPKRMTQFDPFDFGLLIIDEAHHSTAQTYTQILGHYRQNPALKVIGFTATPDRADEEALGQVFEDVAYQYELTDAIEDGWLVPIRQSVVEVGDLDYSQVRVTAGDLNQGDIAKAQSSESVLHGMIVPTIEIAGDRRTIVFCSPGASEGDGDRYHISDRTTEILNRYRPGSARLVSCRTPRDERRAMLSEFEAGRFQYLVNVGVLTEGFDSPGVQCIAMFRPTKSRSLYSQMVGRATRTMPANLPDMYATSQERRDAIRNSAKPFAEIIDFTGNSGRHKLVNTADILGGRYSDEVIEMARKDLKERRNADTKEALDRANAEVLKRIEEERRKRLAITAKARYSVRRIDPFDILDIAPVVERGWDRGRLASEKQIELLKRMRVDVPDKCSHRQASVLIDEIISRRKNGLATYGQTKLLGRYGIDAKSMSFRDAKAMIDEIARNGWRLPRRVLT